MRRRWAIGAGLAVLAAVLWLAWGTEQGGPASGPTVEARAPHEEERSSSRPLVPVAALSWESRPPSGGGLHISGTVLGADGLPLAGAEILATAPVPHETLSELNCPNQEHPKKKLLYCSCDRAELLLEELLAERRGEAPPLARTMSDTAGRFTLEGLGAGPHALWTQGSFGAGVKQRVSAGTEGVTLQVRPGMSHSGQVLDEQERPVPGALITVIFAGHSRFFETLTGADGHWRLGPVPAGFHHLFFTKAGFVTENFTVDHDLERDQRTLQRQRRLVGRVVLGDQPVAGVRVHAEGRSYVHDTTTDAQGRFTLEGLRPREYTVSATNAGLEAAVLADTSSAEGAPELLLKLGSGARVSGRVRDVSGNPIPGATLTAQPLEDDKPHPRVETRTDADGAYVLGPLEPGDYDFRVRARGYVSQSDLEVRARGHTVRDFVLEPSVLIEGRVVGSGGEPVEGVRLSLSKPDSPVTRDRVTSGEDGTFLLAAPAPGTYSLRVGHEQYLPAMRTVLAPSNDLQVVLSSGAWVTVGLVDELGAAVPEARVWLERENAQRGWATTDEGGRATFKGQGAGKYVVHVRAGEGALAWRLRRDFEISGTESVRLQLQLEEGLPLSGLVVDDSGRPLPGAGVRLQRWPMAPEPPGPGEENDCIIEDRTPLVLTGPDGRFRVEHLEAGRDYRLRASKEGYESTPDMSWDGRHGVFRTGTTDVRLVLERLEPSSSPAR